MIEVIAKELEQNAKGLDEEFRRLFHGRGGIWEEWRFVTVDSIDSVLLVQFFYDAPKMIQQKVIETVKKFMQNSRHSTLVLKHRYIKGSKTEVLQGEIPEDLVAKERGLKFALNLLDNQNIGYFGDMKNGRAFVESIAKDKKVLNLFSYTCGFSLAAKRGGAKEVANVDMSKKALSVGMKNHALNNLEQKGVSFLPYNILKSFPKLKRKAPYDIIIIDPPTFQKGSFEAQKDYQKIIAKLPELASDDAVVLACLNSPDLDSRFLIDQITTLAPSFEYVKRLENVKEYKSADEERSLKNLVFHNRVSI